MVTEDIQANAAVRVDIWVVDAGSKVHFRRLKRIIGWEVDGEEKYTPRVGTVTL